MTDNTESIFVSKDYIMNPEDDVVLFDGTELKPGMIVLIEDDMCRTSERDRDNEWGRTRYLENNRWCEVLRVHVQERFDYDEYGTCLGRASALVNFTAKYPDDTVMKRRYDASFAWIVKKISMPAEDES